MSVDTLVRHRSLPELVPAREGTEPLPTRLWSATWPKLLAVGLALAVWQLVVLSGWKPEFVLPGPATVGVELWHRMATAELWLEVATTMRRAVVGYAVAVLVGSLVGIAVSRWRVLRLAVGSLITGLQTMPSIAWFPLAILLFQLSESAILFVVILGAAPSVANGIIGGIDHVPPQLLRAGHMLGARGVARYRYVVLPAALPSYIGGLKQGWAFAWRSLMAGELLVIIQGRPALGADLQLARDNSDAPGLLAVMIVILVIGMVMDHVFTRWSDGIRRRRGLAAG